MESARERRKTPIPCDQCRKRKVRCDYSNPCERCQTSSLACTYTSVRKKRGPKRGRGSIVEQLRAQGYAETAAVGSASYTTQPGPLPPSTPITPATLDPLLPPSSTALQAEWSTPGDAIGNDYFSFDDFAQNVLASSNWPLPQGSEPWRQLPGPHGLSSVGTPSATDQYASPLSHLTTVSLQQHASANFEASELAQRSVELFFTHMYPIYSIVERRKVETLMEDPSSATRSESCLMWSICAMTIMHVDRWPGLSSEQRVSASRHFIRKCLEARLEVDLAESATYNDVLTSLFVGIALFELKCRKASWFHVREAITLAHAAGLEEVGQNVSLTHDERLRQQRAYVLLFITERGACVLDEFPVSTLNTPDLPHDSCADEDPLIASGLQSLYNLFAMLDYNFVKLWNDPARFASTDKGYPELAALQDHLREPMDLHGVSDIQRADVLITQQWLRLVFWQAALKKGLITTSNTHPAFSYDYPLTIASTLCDIVKSLPPIAIQVHGLGIFEKEFEIAYSLLDTLTFSNTAHGIEHHENLRYLLLSLSADPSSRQIYVRTLEKKMGGSAEPRKYRSLAGVQLLRDDSGSRQTSRRQSTAVLASARR
ncbi:hypothetical protein M409DRAFT_18098 [Zasmidium cellare ATCC 36951]|uniref:Zn(2)-C6 fungal-type domain-containing protein n=1 Tax=Zasmidium cellare ATCC 36951 TaxID=1080233 RepID=A0A6A6D2K8_ZASCE|nr:uncharacterized protein M409DRAFT_18098 [Zasmidium cellare ATCC 36951]KAF2171866.1 hypothetical protein M409DRAFT_18098 [Zasmidium cellare ATCC 36951]